jgi:hypothetical protein
MASVIQQSVILKAPPEAFRHVYHLADAANWASIRRRGLLSASRLIDLAGLTGARRARIERAQRLASLTLPNGAVLRDQLPMPPSALERCLVDMTPAAWYALINSRVFFWLDANRLNRQRRAGGASPRAVIMIIDAQALLAAHGPRAAFSPINTGNARRKPAIRGRGSFVPYAAWLAGRWDSEAAALGTKPRPPSHPPVELTVEGSVPDVMDFVVSLHRLDRDEPFES